MNKISKHENSFQLDNFSIKARNFKCFGEDEQGFERIKLINLIIGRNNSGKSTLLDLIEHVVTYSSAEQGKTIEREFWHKGKSSEIITESPLTESEIRKVFPENTHGGGIPGTTHWQFGKKLIGTHLIWILNAPNNNRFISIDECSDGTRPLTGFQEAHQYLRKLADAKDNPLYGKVFRRIYAERNIAPEADISNIDISGDGSGATRIIQAFINKKSLPHTLVETDLLRDLNEIFRLDAEFSDIVCQQDDKGTWEVYLEEDIKGRIPLSQSGSGLKTIILVLIHIHLLPYILKKDISQFVFGFEELENNLHPALLRRLLCYLHTKAKAHGCIFFLTTHSNVEIDLFSTKNDSQIIHVTHDGKQALCRTVQTYIDNKGILDDLDVRASDLLQSNGIIWVEGPSDRIYLNKWISLWSEGKLTEGTHYQCVFYGGRLLSHLSSEEPSLVNSSISLLSVNKNSIIIIDSDRREETSSINSTKTRIVNEIMNTGGISWVTMGKEIENYLSSDVISGWLKKTGIEQVQQFENFFEYLDKQKSGEGKRYVDKKPLLAEALTPYMTRENIATLDLAERLDDVCNRVRQWNGIFAG